MNLWFYQLQVEHLGRPCINLLIVRTLRCVLPMTESIWRHQAYYKDITLNCGVRCYSRLVITKFLLARARINSSPVAHRTERITFMST